MIWWFKKFIRIWWLDTKKNWWLNNKKEQETNFCILKNISKMSKLGIKIGKSIIWEFKNVFETEKLRF